MSQERSEIESIAKVLIIDNQYRALILRLSEHRSRPEKSFTPDLPGGIVDPGESGVAAAVREVYEECAVVLNPHDLQLAYAETTYHENESKSVTKLLYVTYVDKTPHVTLSWEHGEYKWLPVSILHTVDVGAFFNTAIDYCRKNHLLRSREAGV